MSKTPQTGMNVSLLTKSNNRFEGRFLRFDPDRYSIILTSVRCFGTESRPSPRPMAPSPDIFSFMEFRCVDVLDCEPIVPEHTLFYHDPAVVMVIKNSSAGADYSADTSEQEENHFGAIGAERNRFKAAKENCVRRSF
ncbi:protein LSM14 homolog B-like [Aethina tumida]|uniref:protein LSM14 homolog B-like n=1 Tax=Aethina tumida TaxID=116153 RepID=UPI00214787C1|nr:protein LSM14 homolog B-like [Aethina tumida]